MKLIQIYYQLKNRLFSVKRLPAFRGDPGEIYPLALLPLPYLKSPASGMTFTFLNLSHNFADEVDWAFMGHGKLWNYNLQYADFIQQTEVAEIKRIGWIRGLYTSLYSGLVKPEPYPVSLRTMNMIRFMSEESDRISAYPDIIKAIRAELIYLHAHYEYHLLGNHLLENGFAMLMGSCFFKNDPWYIQAEKILREQLEEQILEDGAHFELSPMYHQIILFRILEAISYISPGSDFYIFLLAKAARMLGWLKTITFNDGSIPHFNDSADKIAYTTGQLLDMAAKLGCEPDSPMALLSESGYRKFEGPKFEIVIDAGGIVPSYQPGHAHADHLSYILHANGKPFIVDPGISTYNIGKRRQWERSTAAHNTVTLNNMDSSEVWGGFRVGGRAQVKIIREGKHELVAQAEYPIGDGRSLCHHRSFSFNRDEIDIFDLINIDETAISRIYFHPGISCIIYESKRIRLSNGCVLEFTDDCTVTMKDYIFNAEYNMHRNATVLEASFKSRGGVKIT